MLSKFAPRYLIVNLVIAASLLFTGCPASAPHQADIYIDDAREAQKANRTAEARTLAEMALEEGRRTSEAREILAEIARDRAQALSDEGEYRRAHAAYLQAVEYEPSRVQRAEDRVAAVVVGDRADLPAEDMLQLAIHALDGLPGSSDLHRDIARRAEDIGDDDLAIEHYIWLFSANPEDAHAGLRLGLIFLANDRHRDAASILQRVYDLAPQNTQAALNLANTYAELRRYDEADQIFEHLHEQFPDHPAILKNYADFEEQRGNFNRARQLRNDAAPDQEEREMRPLR